jgi:hypothetical protein
MLIRSISILAIVLGLSANAIAGEHRVAGHRWSCSMVRYYVALYSAPAAEQYARSKGATESEIEAARHCVRADAGQTGFQSR